MNSEDLGWVKASEYRKQVLKCLDRQEMATPSEIAESTGYHLSNVSKTLSTLQDRGLVECQTPELKKGRLYALTEEGQEIPDYIQYD